MGKSSTGPTALQFQSVYEKRQHEIRMTEEMERMLEELSRKMTLGIITNGPSEHQRDKVRALGVERWIPMERIWISGVWAWESPIKRFLRQPGKSWD